MHRTPNTNEGLRSRTSNEKNQQNLSKKMAVWGCNFYRYIVKHSLRQKSTYSRP